MTVSRLFLLRHAKASRGKPGVRDFDRTLNDVGHADAQAMGNKMHRLGYVPDMTLCSGALRARQTLEGVAAEADTGRVVFCDRLYSEDATGYLKLIRENASSGSILVIGHNPIMEELAIAICSDGEPAASALLHLGYPTAGLAVIEFAGGLETAATGTGFLAAFHAPSEH